MTHAVPRSSPLLLLCLSLLASPSLAQEGEDEPVSESEVFPNAHLLVTCEWLAEHQRDAGLVVVDVRTASDYASGHVPGAVHLATAETFDPQRMGDVASRAHVAERLGARGIEAGTHVVLYDQGKTTTASRVLWTLELYGHAKVSVLDGGIVKWQADGLDVSQDDVQPTATEYRPGEPLEVLSTKAAVLAGLDDEQCVAVDARSPREFFAGRVPGAVHIDWVENFSADEVPVFLPPAKLRALYEERGVTPDKRIHAY